MRFCTMQISKTLSLLVAFFLPREDDGRRGPQVQGLSRTDERHSTGALLVECVPNAGRNALIQSHLASLCKDMHWGLPQLTFDLKDQWPMSRNRWYCIMSEECFLPPTLPRWNIVTEGNTVGDILGSFLPSDFPGIEPLLVTSRELSFFQNPAFGADSRKLELHHVCSTVLHSYGSPLDNCPCWRGMGFAEATLVAKGLRGFFVSSPDSQEPRYLHEQELRMLFALPKNLSFPEDQAALCLYGLMAAPLQVIWVFSNFLYAASSSASDVVPLHPQLILEEYKAQIRMVLCQSPHRRQKFLWASATYWSLSHLRSISRHFLGLHGQSRTISSRMGDFHSTHS